MPNHARKVMHGEVSPAFIVHVTQEHIDTAIRCNGNRCMLKEAIADAYGRHRALFIQVDAKCMQFSDAERDRRFYYFHSNKTLKAFMDWDQGKPVKPFSFELRDGQVRTRLHNGNAPKHKKQHSKSVRRGLPRGARKFGVCMYTPKAALAARHA